MNILVAYDGTKEAKEAVRLATRHAKAFNARIILVFSMVGGPEIPARSSSMPRRSSSPRRSS